MVTIDQSWVLGGGDVSNQIEKKMEPLLECPVGSELVFLVEAIHWSSKLSIESLSRNL